MNMFEQMPFSEKYPVFRKLAEIGDLRKLSFFLIKVKDIYILVTKTGYFKAFALAGRQVCVRNYLGRCPGLGASAPSGRIP